MKLRELKALFVDCQTTGMRPPAAHLLEISWAIAAANEENVEVRGHLVALPDGARVPQKIQEITGISDEEMTLAKPIADVFNAFKSSLGDEPAFIHYAQFEKPFLVDLFKTWRRRRRNPV